MIALIPTTGVAITGDIPVAMYLLEGTSNPSFTVTTTLDNANVSYKWFKNNATTSFSTIVPTITLSSYSDKDKIYCQVTNIAKPDDVVISNTCVINVIKLHTISVDLPATATMSKETPSDLELTISATGTGGVNYQWYQNGNPVSGATSNTHVFKWDTLTTGDTFYCIVSSQYYKDIVPNLKSTTLTLTITERTFGDIVKDNLLYIILAIVLILLIALSAVF
jgi:hypothetical protein